MPIYVIRLTDPQIAGCYVGENKHWVFEREHAKTFNFEVSATGYAIMTWGLQLDEFVVELR